MVHCRRTASNSGHLPGHHPEPGGPFCQSAGEHEVVILCMLIPGQVPFNPLLCLNWPKWYAHKLKIKKKIYIYIYIYIYFFFNCISLFMTNLCICDYPVVVQPSVFLLSL